VRMKWSFGFTVLLCPRGTRKMRVLSTITAPAGVRKSLAHLAGRASPLPRARARAPDGEQTDLGFEAA
jgi:hypothetical protein